MTGTPVAFRRRFICITWERNLVPILRSNSELCSEGFPQYNWCHTVWWAHSLSVALALPVISRGIFWDQTPSVFLTHIIFYVSMNVLFSWWLHWSRWHRTVHQGGWSVPGLYLTHLQWNYSWFTLVQKNLEWSPKTTGLCPNGPLHKVNHKKSLHSVSNLLTIVHSTKVDKCRTNFSKVRSVSSSFSKREN